MPVVALIKKLDKLSKKNNEIFVKAYFKLHVVAFPSLLALFTRSLSASGGDGRQEAGAMLGLNEESDLVQLVMAQSKYFFDIKLNKK